MDCQAHRMPEHSMAAQAAYQLVKAELHLDADPTRNLATFGTSWMEPEANRLIMDALGKNLADRGQYSQTFELEQRCVSIIANLFNAPGAAVGTSTVGSSEAATLCGLTHKFAWIERRRKAGKPWDSPNMVFGMNSHAVWHKFCKYHDVLPRAVPMRRGVYTLDLDAVMEQVDENTIMIGPILGQTFTGQLDDIYELNRRLLSFKERTGLDIPIHVDGASGGFVLPFTRPDLLWDFRLPQVKSINVSGHKFGLVYPGVGWAIWRDRDQIPEELVFAINYLGGQMGSLGINFSQSAAFVTAQYYNFVRYGMEGYRKIIRRCMDNAHYLCQQMPELGFDVLSAQDSIPIMVATLRPDSRFTVFELSDLLKTRGWMVPSYTLPANAQEVAVIRVVVRESVTRQLIDIFLAELRAAVEALKAGTKTVDWHHSLACSIQGDWNTINSTEYF